MAANRAPASSRFKTGQTKQPLVSEGLEAGDSIGGADVTVLGRLSDFMPDDLNANKGTPRGQAMIEKSLRRLGAGRSILVDKNNRIIAGNKTAEAAAGIGIEDAIVVKTRGNQVVVVQREDLDIETVEGREMALFDNRTNEVSLTWDADVLATLSDKVDLSQFWTDRELELVLSEVKPESAADGEYDDLDEVSSTLPGAMALKADMVFESDLPWGIPGFMPERLADLPEHLDVWAGPDALPEDDDYNVRETHWVYCYGSDSTRGIPWDQTILAFYVDDTRFDRWWLQPEVYTAKMMNVGLTTIIAPNFSLWLEMPKAVQLYNTFKARWLGRYFQEAGLSLIPDVNWSDDESFEFCLIGIPKNAPVLSIQVQTVSTPAEISRLKYGIQRALRELEPQKLLLYGGGKNTKKMLAGSLPNELPVRWLDSRSIRRHDRVMSDKAQHRLMTSEARNREDGDEGSDDDDAEG